MKDRLEHIQHSMSNLLGLANLEYSGSFVDVGDNRIHYLDYGTGPDVLLIHGGGGGGGVWFDQIAALSSRFRLIVPDNLFFGLSTGPAVPTNIQALTSGYLTEFMNQMGIEKASIVGQSIGGYAATRLSIERSDLVDRLVLISSAGFGKHLPFGFRMASLPLIDRILSREIFLIHKLFFENITVKNRTSEQAAAYLEYAHLVRGRKHHAEAIRRHLTLFVNIKGQKNIFSKCDLAQIQAPTMVIQGRQDKFFPIDHAINARKLIKNSTLEIIEQCGHIPMLDKPEIVNDLIIKHLEND